MIYTKIPTKSCVVFKCVKSKLLSTLKKTLGTPLSGSRANPISVPQSSALFLYKTLKTVSKIYIRFLFDENQINRVFKRNGSC